MTWICCVKNDADTKVLGMLVDTHDIDRFTGSIQHRRKMQSIARKSRGKTSKVLTRRSKWFDDRILER